MSVGRFPALTLAAFCFWRAAEGVRVGARAARPEDAGGEAAAGGSRVAQGGRGKGPELNGSSGSDELHRTGKAFHLQTQTVGVFRFLINRQVECFFFCFLKMKPRMKDLVDQDSSPPQNMTNIIVVTDSKFLEGLLNFGKIKIVSSAVVLFLFFYHFIHGNICQNRSGKSAVCLKGCRK